MDKLKKIWLSPPHMSGYEQVYVQEAFESNWIAPIGKNITSFEEELAAYSGMNVLAVNSGTSAMHLALLSLNIQKGDYIFCQSLTFAGCAFPIQYQQATPVFIDSESGSWNMDPDLLEEAIKKYMAAGKKPKAIIVVHIYGMPASMDRIVTLARHFEIPLIEDAAEAVGSRYNLLPLGSFGDYSIYSFNGNKIITTSGGGAFLCKDASHLQHARKLSEQSKENLPHYEHQEVGYNYRLSNVCAGIGRGQLKVLDERVKRKREIFELYKSIFRRYPQIRFQDENNSALSNRWLTVIYLDSLTQADSNVETVRLALTKLSIESRPIWKPMHRQPVFQTAPAFINGVSDHLFENGICLPSGTALTDEEIKNIAEIVVSTINHETISI